ncbi:MAG: PKD domain-containing protein [Flavobacteriales bacterium]|nr:PKD domain-containing protein [Flavobacteriales bacterium]
MKTTYQFICAIILTIISIYNLSAQVEFTQDFNSGCTPLMINYTNESVDMNGVDTTNYIFTWWFEDGDSIVGYHATYEFKSPGWYNVELRADSMGFNKGTWDMGVQVNGADTTFYMSKDTACPGEEITFEVSAQYDNLDWDFGDGMFGSSSTEHVYKDTGDYTIELTWATMCGSETLFEMIRIDSSAVPNVMITSSAEYACKNDEIEFYAEYDGMMDSYVWDFGDDDSSWTSDPYHMYADTGTHQVMLLQTNSCGNTGTDTMWITIDTTTVPWANFYSESEGGGSSCPFDEISFENQSSPGSYEWDFDDGDMSNDYMPMHSYDDTATYNVRLIVTNGCDFKDTAWSDVMVKYDMFNPPDLELSFEDADMGNDSMAVCPGRELYFNADVWSNGGDAMIYWDFDDGKTDSIQEEMSHTYSIDGMYDVQVVAINNCMASDTAWLYVKVDGNTKPMPRITFLPDSICPNENAYIFDDMGRPEETGWSYDIWYGDGDSTMNITDVDETIEVLSIHQYFSLGEYNYKVHTTNLCGNTDTTMGVLVVSTDVSDPFYYIENSTMSDDPGWDNSGCPDDTVEFFAIGGVDWYWNFGDGSDIDTGFGVTHVYSAEGMYNAEVYILNGCGEIDTVETMVEISNTNKPDAWFDISEDYVCVGDTIWVGPNYYNDRDDIDNNTYTWDFGDGTMAYTMEAYHVYSAGGMMNINRTVENGCGANMDDRGVSVNDLPDISIDDLRATYCIDDMVETISATPMGGDFEGPGMSGDSFDPAMAADGMHYITYEVEENGCWNIDSVATEVYELPVTEAGEDAYICPGGDAQLNATGGVSYMWNANITLSDENIANPIASPVLTTQYYVKATGLGGCIAANMDSLIVDVDVSLQADAGEDQSICEGETLELEGEGGGLYSWWPSTGVSDTSVGNPTAMPMMDITYYMAIYSGACADTDTVVITVYQLPNVTLAGYGDVCEDVDPWMLSGGAPALGTYWGDGVSGGEFDPAMAGEGTHTITYEYSDTESCTGSAIEDITVNPLPDVSFLEMGEICIDGMAWTLTSVSPSGGGFVGDGISGADFDPAMAGIGVHTIKYGYTDGNGCTDTAMVNIEVYDIPNVMLGTFDDVCKSAEDFPLYGGSPAGGEYSGDDVTFGWFDPSAALISTTAITYEYTDDNGCWGEAMENIEVVAEPDAMITDNMDTLTAGASYTSYEWLLDGVVIAGVDSNEHLPMATGNYEVVAWNASGCRDTSDVYPFIYTAVRDINVDSVKAYPNPTRGQFHVYHQGKNNTLIEVFDVTGKRVYRGITNGRTTKQAIDLSAEPQGMYMVRVTTGNETHIRKIVKQ